jgi:steroid delta-isomerase-like uncharacterized protein
MTSSIRTLTLRWFDEVWNRKIRATIVELTSPHLVAEMEGVAQPMGQDEVLAYHDALVAAVPDLQMSVVATTVEGDRVVTEWQLSGRHTGPGLGIPPTGAPLTISGLTCFVWKDGVIVRGWDRWNRGKLLADLNAAREQDLRRRFGLTPREAEVAQLMASRRTHKEIAKALAIRPNTARRHCERVLKKLRIASKTHVAELMRVAPDLRPPAHGIDLTG